MIVDLLNKKCHYPLEIGEYYIYDDEENHKPDFVDVSGKWNIKIVNNSINNIDFFQNDGCLMTQNELKKCDWVSVFQNEFYFIEAKNISKPARRKKQRKDAIEKFDATISFYLEVYPSIVNMDLHIIMNFRSSKITRSADKARVLYFKEKYDADYIETNHLDFK